MVPLVLSASFGALAAQDRSGTLASCDGRVISSVTITARAPEYPAVPSRMRLLARTVGILHTTTTARVIDRFLLLDVGERCTERRRSESERILRLQPFLADAAVRAVPDGTGGVRIEVETIDEIPAVLHMRFRDFVPSTIRFGNGNVGGQGLYVAGSVERGFAYRTGWGLYGVAYQVFGRPYTLAVSAHRAPLGGALTLALGYPFLTDLQRSAWHVGYGDANQYASFARRDEDALALSVLRRFWDFGGVRRLGSGPQSTFVGVLVTGEDVAPASRFVIVSDSGLVADASGALGSPVPAYHNVRLNAVVGARALSFMPVRGFDALVGVQDVATGVQLGVLGGQSIPRLGSVDADRFVSTDLYAGLGSARSFAALRAEGEARQDRRTGHWDSMVGSGRLAWYVKPTDAHVLIGSVEVAGGWRVRVPFQLRLGDGQGGVRGFRASSVAGSVRSVVRIEEHWLLGRLTRHAAIGLAGFADAGRVWAGDAPFGTDSNTKVGVGLGVLAAFPPESQRLWRLDVAVPLGGDPDAHWEVRITGVWTRAFWREPEDVARVRAGASPSTIFTWR